MLSLLYKKVSKKMGRKKKQMTATEMLNLNINKNTSMNTGKRRGRPRKNQVMEYQVSVPAKIDFDIVKLNNLDIDPRMMDTMKSGMIVDDLISHEGGIPCATNIMCIGDPGVGKTTVLLDILAGVQNRGRKCLFISGEMGKKQMFKYTQRFPQFGNIQTLFMSDYLEHNTKDVIEQVMNMGWDLILIDSIAEIIEGVRDDNKWDRKQAESWMVDLCVKNNKGENKKEAYTSFLLIQQVTKSGEFVGSNKLKHMTDAMMEMRRESERDGGGTYMNFIKNRNGNVDVKFGYQLNNDHIYYGTMVNEDAE
jgi:predicted ATP-dependent serine protease